MLFLSTKKPVTFCFSVITAFQLKVMAALRFKSYELDARFFKFSLSLLFVNGHGVNIFDNIFQRTTLFQLC